MKGRDLAIHYSVKKITRLEWKKEPNPCKLFTAKKNLHSNTYKAQADALTLTCTSSTYPSPFSNQSRLLVLLHHPPGLLPSTPFGFRSRKRNGKRSLISHGKSNSLTAINGIWIQIPAIRRRVI
ncbi:hypothetical protein OIU77_010280 [Salix suchowensis]|uniref:Uncharacterized protein n=1 Tax=Salix suchowensis TaxID=1278906 RepID=A0ABQ9A8W0_9ROSI|nr:hypothetical protein OIU77_010280 [Salix suchowensis]